MTSSSDDDSGSSTKPLIDTPVEGLTEWDSPFRHSFVVGSGRDDKERTMEDRIWMVIADACLARILELCKPGEPPRLVEELKGPIASRPPPGKLPTTDEMQRFARQIVDRLEQAYADARFEYLRIAAAPRFIDRLRMEVDKHIDLHRAVLEWRPLDLIDLDDIEAVSRMGPCSMG
jgi:hypothetical protein